MEDNCILNRPKYFTIGDFNILFQKTGTEICVEIPFAGMAFYHPEERTVDFSLLIEAREED